MEQKLTRRTAPMIPGGHIARAIRGLRRVRDYCRELGLQTGLQWYFSRVLAHLSLPSVPRMVIKPRDLRYPIIVEMNPRSDEYVFNQLFIRREYAPLCEHVKDPKSIIDLGANVGYASAFFASRYPGARILAVEPDPRNFELCCRNLKPYGEQIKVLKGAVWPYCSRLALCHEFGDGLATQVKAAGEDGEAQVEGWDMVTLLDMAQAKVADVVKIDIERSEAELFGSNTAQWLSRVRNICIELHDNECRQIFFGALREFDYDTEETGEFTMCLNLRKRGPAKLQRTGKDASTGAAVKLSPAGPQR